MAGTSKEKANRFVDCVNLLFLEIYGEEMSLRERTRMLVYVSDYQDDEKPFTALGGNGCPMCALTELNAFVVINGLNHVGDETILDTETEEIPPNLRN